MNWENNIDFKDDVKITDYDENVLDINVFSKLIKVTQDSNNFESHKILFLYGSLFFS